MGRDVEGREMELGGGREMREGVGMEKVGARSANNKDPKGKPFCQQPLPTSGTSNRPSWPGGDGVCFTSFLSRNYVIECLLFSCGFV